MLCGFQELAFRGHREDGESSNRGNFLELMTFASKHDSVVRDRLFDGPRNAMYTSHSIQNELIHIVAEKTRGIICDGVKNAGPFSIMADETKDYSKQEQLCLVVRYVGNVKQHFLSYVQATSLNAESLSLYIKEQLIHYGLDPNNIVSQGYDGASVMSGSCSGVQVRIKEVAPCAHYIHCYAYNLNLVLVDTVKSVPDAMEFFTLLEHIYVFMSASKAHVVFMEKQ